MSKETCCVNTRIEKHGIHEPSMHEQDFSVSAKRLGMSASDGTFSMQAYKTNVLILGMFMSSSMQAAIHLGPNYLANSEIYKNTKFEEIESVFNITRKLVREHSEEILHVKCVEYASPSWDQYHLMVKRSSGQKQKYVSMLIPFYVLDR